LWVVSGAHLSIASAGELLDRVERSLGALANRSCLSERSLQADDVGSAEDEAVARRDVDEIEVDAGVPDLASQVGEDARPILDFDDDDLALPTHGELRERQRVLGGPGMGNEDVQLDCRGRPDARRGREIHACVADRRRDASQGSRLVLDLDDQVEGNRLAPPVDDRRRELSQIAFRREPAEDTTVPVCGSTGPLVKRAAAAAN